MSAKTLATLLCVTLLPCACAEYVPAPGAATARFNLQGAGRVKMCAEQSSYVLKPSDDEGYAIIPADQQITIARDYTFTKDGRNFSCSVAVGFVPQSSMKYAQQFRLDEMTCYMRVVREDDKVPAGIVREPSAHPGDRCN